MDAGRPTDYSPEIIERAEKYLEECKDSFEFAVSDNGKFSHAFRQVNLPSVEGLAAYLGKARSTLYLWAKEHEEFSDIFEKILAEQAKRLINNGLSGDYGATIAKLMLTKHGYTDRQDITSDEKPISSLLVEIIRDGKDNANTGGV